MLDSIEVGFVLKVLQAITVIGMMVVIFYQGRTRKQTLNQLKEYVEKFHPKLWQSWQYDPMKMGKNTVLLNIQQWCAIQKTQQHSDEKLEQLKKAFLRTETLFNKFSIYFGILICINILSS